MAPELLGTGKMRWFYGLFFALALTACAWVRYYERYRADVLRVLLLDVGQGDSALVVFPGGKTALIDAGGGYGDWDFGKKEVFPELTRRGILKLDYALLSHPDKDHGYGFTSLFSEIEIGELWFNRLTPDRPLMAQLRQIARSKGIREHPIGAREKREISGVEWETWPSRGRTRNDWALLSRLRFAGCEILFTADIEVTAEEALIKQAAKPVTLLKVAHHGSKTSTGEAFLKWARPKWAVISAGHRNRYGHPHRAVLERLARWRVHVLRTDYHGFVEFTLSREGRAECRTAQGSCGSSLCGGGL